MRKTSNQLEKNLLADIKLLSSSGHMKIDDSWLINRDDRMTKIDKIETKNIKNIHKLSKVIACECGIELMALRGHSRARKIAEPRQILCYIAYNKLGLNLNEIARYLNGRHHTSILNAVHKSVPNLIFNDKGVEDNIEYLWNMYLNGK